MSIFTFINRCAIAVCLLLFTTANSYAQRIYADDQQNGRSSLLCLGCVVTDPDNAADGNPQTFSVINVALGVAAQTYQELVFTGSNKPAANTPVRIKLGTGDNLVDLTLLGGVSIRAYNGAVPAGPSFLAPTLVTAVSNNNQFEVGITTTQPYDRIRITVQGGLVGLLSSLYVYDGYFNGTGPAACNAAADELHGISPGLLNLGVNVGGVANPHNAIDGDINTASTLNAGIGAVGAFAQQTIIYNTPSVIGDSIRLTLSIPESLIQAGVLSGIGVSTYLGNESNNDTENLASALLVVRLLDLNNNRRKVTVTFAPTKVFDRVQLRLGGVVNVLSTLNLFEAEKLIPRPEIKVNNAVVNNVQTCAGSQVTLTATAVPNTTFKWYTAETGGAPIFTGGSYQTGVLNAGTTLYVSATRAGCTDESERIPVVITVNQIPAAPLITDNNIIVCPGQQATFAAPIIVGTTVRWYTAATGGTPVFTGNTFTTDAITQTTNFYAEAVTGGTCESTTRTMVSATISPLPANPTLTNATVTICSGDVAALSVASPVSGVTYKWYGTATGGTPIYTGVNFTTPTLTTNISYYVEAENATGCTSGQRALATVTVQAKPTAPSLAANNLTIAAGQKATITVSNAQTGITYNWYSSANAATPIFTGTTYTTDELYTNTTFYVAAVNSTGCQSATRTAITINVTIDNNSPCTFANDQSGNVNGLCIGCGVTNNLLATDADTTTASTIHVVAGLLGGYAEQELRFQQTGFAGDTIRLVVQTPVALADVDLLGRIEVALYNNTTQVVRYALDNALIKVRLLGGTNRYAISIPANGTYNRVSIRLSSGLATLLTSLNVYYAVQQFPAPVFNPAAPEICKGSPAQINITSAGSGLTFKWYTTPTGGANIHTGASYTTGALTGNTTYYIEVSRGTCVGSVRYPVGILVNDPPAKAVVAPTTASIFSGQTATFTATAGNNVTVKWYEAASGGTAVHTGNTFTTPVLTANKIYYAETSIGDCVNPDRTPATVNVTPIVIPNIAVNPPTQTVNPGASATLTASSTTPGTIFNWYTTPTGGTSIFTGATFNTPAVFSNTTYYAEAVVQATGAKSATRASGVVNINSSAVNPVPCDAAIDQTTDINGLICLGCSIANQTGSVDNDQNTFSRLIVPVGLLNAYAQQTLRFAATGRAGDSVVLELGLPGTLANVNVLSQIQLATYNGATYNNDRFSVNGALLTIRLLDGASRFRVAFKANSDFDRVEIRLNSTLAGVFNALNIYAASQAVAAPVITTAGNTACEGTQTTLTATVPDHVTVRWYTTPTGGTPVFTGSVFNTPALNTTTTYYAEASRTGSSCAQAVRTPATVTVTPAPVAPVVTTPTVTVCSGSPATFTAQAVAGVIFRWYTTATGGTPVFTGATYTTGPLTSLTTYFVEAAAGTCESSTRTQVTANVTATPLVPTVSQTPVQTCSGSSAVLAATSTQPGVTFRWYTTATGGTPVFTGAQFTTPDLTTNTSYYVEAQAGNCVSATRAKADVIVNPAPVNPVVTTNPAGGQITSGQTATLTATSTTAGATFRWYSTASGGTPIFTGAAFTTPQLSSTTTYYVEARIAASGCISPQRTAVTVTVNPIFSTSCDFASAQVNSVVGGVACIGCGVSNPDDAVDTDTANFSRLSLPVSLLGSSVSQRLIFSDNGTVGDTVVVKLRLPVNLLGVGVLNGIQIASYNGAAQNADRISLNSSLIHLEILAGNRTALVKFAPQAGFNAVEVTITDAVVSLFNNLDIFYATKQVEAPQLAATTVNICSGTEATFTVSNPRAGVSYKWYTTASGGASVFTGTTFTTGDLIANTTYYVESTRDGNNCPNPNRVAATANVTPSPVNPVLNQASADICAGETVTFAVTNANSATVRWYNAATGGTLLFTGASYTVTPVTNATYYAELSNGDCNSPARTVATVTVNPRPSIPGVQSASVQVCTGSPATLQVLNPEAGVTYRWYDAATAGTLAFTGPTFTTGNITANTSYYVEASNTATSCINNGGRKRVDITINALPTAPTLSAATSQVCSGGSVTLSVTNPVAGTTYRWYSAATAGTLAFTGTTFTVNTITANVSYYVEASNSSSCTSSTRTQTTITVLPVPAVPQLQLTGGGNAVCLGSSATLSVVNPQANLVYRWYNAATNGTLLFTGSVYNTPALTTNRTFYVEAANAGNCTSSARAAITVNVTALPVDPVLTASNVSVCLGASATLSVSAPQAGITYRWYSSPAQTTVLFTGSSYTTGPITANSTFYVSASNASGCSSNNLASAQVSVQTAPPAPIIANGNTVEACTGSTATLSIQDPDASETYRWYTAATGGTLAFTGSTITTGALTANVTYFVEASSNNGGCTSASRTAVTINVNPIPVAPVVTAQGGSATPSVCSGTSAILTATSTIANVTFNWYTTANGATPIFTGATYITPVLTANVTYFIEATSAANCSSGTRTPVTVTVTPLPADVTLTANNVNVCLGSTATLSVSSPQAGLTYKWYSSAAKTVLLFTGPTYTTGAINANTTFYVDATSAAGCTSGNLTTAQVTIQTAPPAPVIANGSVFETCTGSTITLDIQNPDANTTYNWYTAATGGTIALTGSTVTTPSLPGAVTYYVEAVSNNGGCTSASRTAVIVNVTPVPVVPVITVQGGSTTPSVCSGSGVTLTATSATPNVTFRWYTAATGGAPIFTGATYTTGATTANTTYFVEAVANSGGCSSPTRGSVNITVTQPPATPQVASNNVAVCAGNSATLAVSSPQANITYNWYSDATRVNKVFTGPSFQTGPVNANITYYLEAANGTCTSAATATVQVTVTTAPGTPVVADAQVEACGGTTATLSVANPQGNITYKWYATATGGTAVFTGATFSPTVNASSIFYVEAENAGGCVSGSRTAVTVDVTPPPTAPQITSQGVTVCPGSTAILTASASSGFTIRWYAAATGGIPLGTGDSFTTPAINAATTYYAEAVANGSGCTSTTRTPAQVTISTPLSAPVLTDGGKTVSSVTFNRSSVSGATAYEISTDNGLTFLNLGNAQSYTVTGLNASTAVTAIIRAIGNTSCETSANSSALTLTTDTGTGLFIPNAFTPNGDGNNDMFQVYSPIIRSISMYVYDQWGELLFRSNNQASGWDGTYKGNRMPVGVYVYYFDATMNDGKKVSKKGTITLLR